MSDIVLTSQEQQGVPLTAAQQAVIVPRRGDIVIGTYGAAGRVLYRGGGDVGSQVRFGENVYTVRQGDYGKELYDPSGGNVVAHTPWAYSEGNNTSPSPPPGTPQGSPTGVNSIYNPTDASQIGNTGIKIANRYDSITGLGKNPVAGGGYNETGRNTTAEKSIGAGATGQGQLPAGIQVITTEGSKPQNAGELIAGLQGKPFQPGRLVSPAVTETIYAESIKRGNNPDTGTGVFGTQQGQLPAGVQVVITKGTKPANAGELLDELRGKPFQPGRLTPTLTPYGVMDTSTTKEREKLFKLNKDNNNNDYSISGGTTNRNGILDSNRNNANSLTGLATLQGNTISAAQDKELSFFGIRSIGIKESQVNPSSKFRAEAQQYQDVDYQRAGTASFLALSTGVAQGFIIKPVFKTSEFIAGIKDSIFHPIETFKGTKEQFITNPEGTVGEFAGGALLFKSIEFATPQVVKNQIPRITYDSQDIPTTNGDFKVQTIGIQQGTRGTPIVSRISEPINIVTVEDIGGTPKVTYGVESANRVFVGKGSQIATTQELAKPIPSPVSVAGSKVQEQLLGLSKEEITRRELSAKISETLQSEKGNVVKNPSFNVKSLPEEQRPSFSKKIDSLVGEEGGVFFGSSTTQQLPVPFANKQIGDVDIFFPKKTSQEINDVIIPRYVKELNNEGIAIRQSATNKAVIEDAAGNKIIEAKSGIDPEVNGEEIALAGFRGIRFADIKAGQSPDTVAFGKAKAITAGEQTARKGAASSFINPPLVTEELPEAFSKGGVFGKVRANDPRTLKDVAGFIQGSEGIVALRREQNFFKRVVDASSTRRAAVQIKQYRETFSPEQIKLIDEKLSEITGEKTIIPTEKTVKNVRNSEELRSPGPTYSLRQVNPGQRVYVNNNTRRESVSPTSSPASYAFFPSALSASQSVNNSPSSSPLVRSSSPISSSSPNLSSSPTLSSSPATYSSLSPSPSSSPSPSISSSPSPRSSPSPFISASPFGSSSPSILSSPSPTYSPTPPKGLSPSPTSTIPPSRKKKSVGLFRTLVRRRGKLFELGVFGSEGEALQKGKGYTERTLGASFKVEGLNGQGIDYRSALQSLGSRYRAPKRGGDFFIQREGYRLSSKSEVSEIQSSRSKKNIFGRGRL